MQSKICVILILTVIASNQQQSLQVEALCQQICLNSKYNSCEICYKKCDKKPIELTKCSVPICLQYQSYYDADLSEQVAKCKTSENKNIPEKNHCVRECCKSQKDSLEVLESCELGYLERKIQKEILSTYVALPFTILLAFGGACACALLIKKVIDQKQAEITERRNQQIRQGAEAQEAQQLQEAINKSVKNQQSFEIAAATEHITDSVTQVQLQLNQ